MATYYVDPVSGSDSNAGTSLALAWKTTNNASLLPVVAGDFVFLCATGSETLLSTATLVDGAYYVGCNSGGVEDGTLYVFSGPSAGTAITKSSSGSAFLKNASISGCSTGFTRVSGTWFLTNVTMNGLSLAIGNDTGAGCLTFLIGCTIIACTVVAAPNGNRSGPEFYRCNVQNCGPLVIDSINLRAIGTIFKNNDFGKSHFSAPMVVIGCIFDNSQCIIDDRTSPANAIAIILNNVFINSGASVNWWGGNSAPTVLDYCDFFGCTTNLTSPPSGISIGAKSLTSDPKLDANYKPLSGSPLIGAGINGAMIGAFGASGGSSLPLIYTGVGRVQ